MRIRSNPKKPIPRRAFTIYEMLVVVILTALIAGLTAPFTARVVKSMYSARDEATTEVQFDNAIELIRKDVWQAVAMQAVSSHEVILTQSDHREVHWRCTGSQLWRQMYPAAGRGSCNLHAASIEFVQQGSALRVNIADPKYFRAGSYCMVSPVMLAAEVRR